MLIGPALAFAFAVQSGVGLSLSFGGVPFIKRSYFQYYEPGWTKGYYSTQWTSQSVVKSASGQTVLSFKSSDGRAYGKVAYTPSGNRLKIDYEFNWDGDKPALIELCGGMVWAPAVQTGRLDVDGIPQRNLMAAKYRSNADIAERQYGPTFSKLNFLTPLGAIGFSSNRSDWVIFDARGFNQDYAEDDDLFWIGCLGIEVSKGKPARFEAEWSFDSKNQALPAPAASVKGVVRGFRQARAVSEPLPIVPKPKSVKLAKGKVFVLGNPTVQLPGDCREEERLFRVFLNSLWQKDPSPGGKVVGKIADLKLPEEGYVIQVTPNAATVTGQSCDGLLNGLYTLALMAYPEKGRLVLPVGEVKDWPTIGWRGIHTFVGPKTVPFHKEFFERVLRPMKFNKAVLQCERSAWKATPGIETSMTMPLEELVKEFSLMRSLGIEPIPLIQSFGHAEWLFANGKNLDIALNPDAPYAIDPRNPKAQQKIKDIWTEAIALLKPKTVHFGMDEVAMIGMKDSPAFVTELWLKQIPFLAGIAAENKVSMMLWGDVGLAKGEAIDACNGDSPEEAKKRRDAIPAGALIADWHYADNPDPSAFVKSLRLWKAEGKVPVASTWYRPGNIRGFVLAAAQEGCGALQTTWAGYESNPQALIASFQQHYAYLTFADYAWSGRQEPADGLGYDPGALLRRLFLAEPGSVKAVQGIAIVPAGATGKIETVGQYRFIRFQPIALRSIAASSQQNSPAEAVLQAKAKAKFVAVAVDCASRCSYFEKVGTVTIELSSGRKVVRELQYGIDVRTPEDMGALVRADRRSDLCAIEIKLGDKPEQIVGIRLSTSNSYAGLRLHGVTAY